MPKVLYVNKSNSQGFMFWIFVFKKGKTPDEMKKIKAFMEVVKGDKKVSMDVLLKCEITLSVSDSTVR